MEFSVLYSIIHSCALKMVAVTCDFKFKLIKINQMKSRSQSALPTCHVLHGWCFSSNILLITKGCPMGPH